MGRIYHAKGVERTVRNTLWIGRTQPEFYDALSWLYSWNVAECLNTRVVNLYPLA
jgi:salicylate hydroxylase